MIAALYLDVTARAAVAGREIQEMRFEITTIQRANADLETQLAELTSTAEMEHRARRPGLPPRAARRTGLCCCAGFCRA